MSISSVLMRVEDWEGLAGWLNVDKPVIIRIKTDCIRDSGSLADCYRKKLVEHYCESTAQSPLQIARDMARVLENKMSNKKVASQLQHLTFGETQKK